MVRYSNLNKHEKAQMIGRINKIIGQHYENMISASCQYYQDQGLARIQKTPEPTKQLSGINSRGHFTACYEKQAQPDYGGTIKGGQSIYFEAKETEDSRIQQSRVTQTQHDDLEAHYNLGALTFVLVSFSLCEFYRIPWEVWRDMKQIYGRKYLKKEELKQYQLPAHGGYIKLLDGIVKEIQS